VVCDVGSKEAWVDFQVPPFEDEDYPISWREKYNMASQSNQMTFPWLSKIFLQSNLSQNTDVSSLFCGKKKV
jgi:hypothetical protein